jgi:hypothetical protein
VKAILDPGQNLRVLLKNLDNVSIRLLEDADRPGQLLGPSCKTGSMVRCSEEDNTTSQTEDILEVSFRSLSRYNKGLPLLE